MIAGLFPTAVRSTGMALAYNVAVTVFGGLSPLTVTWMIQHFDSRMMPAVYLMIAAVISLVLVGATRRVWLQGEQVPAVQAAEGVAAPGWRGGWQAKASEPAGAAGAVVGWQICWGADAGQRSPMAMRAGSRGLGKTIMVRDASLRALRASPPNAAAGCIARGFWDTG